MSERLKPGEYVDVAIKGVRVVEQDEHGCVTVRADAHDGGPAHWPMPPQAAVSRVAPAEWPPRAGDLWRDRHGVVWFAADVHDIEETDVPEIVLVYPHEDFRQAPDVCNQQAGPLTLVHREDEQDGDQA
ncbi:hypothetical protein [Actinomadura luteofluorescens]|uniref:hypothetical protein n=1 Tax=Actinomadura luteofluorescens TaxID=46163 RepID=UPI003D8C19B1